MSIKFQFTTILLFSLLGVVKAQVVTEQIITGKIVDTTATYNWFRENVVKLGMKDLMRSSDPVHFRFWCRNQVLEIWSHDQKSFRGELVSYTSKHSPNEFSNSGKEEKFLSKHIIIDPDMATRIYERATEVALFDLPLQAKIKGYKMGVDGYSVSLEYAEPLKYSMKDYWSPKSQATVPEAKLIADFETFLETKLGLRDKWDMFIDGLPKGCYHTGGLTVVCNSKKSARRLRRSY